MREAFLEEISDEKAGFLNSLQAARYLSTSSDLPKNFLSENPRLTRAKIPT
jgi:hypothetical protein